VPEVFARNPAVPELPKLSHPPTVADVASLNQFIFQLRRLLLGNLTTANQRARYIDAVIQWPTTEVPRIATGLLVRPRSVTLAELRTGTNATIPNSIAATLEWGWDAGAILLPQLVNGTLTTRWAVRLLVVEE
jgi:hypothetical protein